MNARLAGALVLVCLATTPAGCSREANAVDERPQGGVTGGRTGERRATPVVVEPLVVGAVRDEVVASATVDARVTVQVFPKLANLPITEVFVEEGQPVARGDRLMRLYETDLALAERMALASKEEAGKTVEARRLALEEEARRAVRAERQARKAADDLARLADLVDEGLVTQQEVDNARLAAETAADDQELAAFASRGARIQLELAELAAERAELDWKTALTNLEQTLVISPINGVVARRDCEVGELSNLSAPAFTLVDTSDLILDLRLPQDTLPLVRAGQLVSVRSVTHADETFTGRVRVVNPVLDAATGSLPVIVDLDPASGLAPGLFCEVRIVTARRDDALLVSKKAVLYEDDQPVLFVVEVVEQAPGADEATDVGAATAAHDATVAAVPGALGDDAGLAEAARAGEEAAVRHVARRVPFLAGVSTPTQVEILTDLDGQPLEPGLRVVVVGQENLKDGDPIKVVEEAY